MSTFLSDRFESGAGENLIGHTANIGGAWVDYNHLTGWVDGNHWIGSGGGRILFGDRGVARSPAVPGNAFGQYDLICYHNGGGDGVAAVFGRMAETEATFYLVAHEESFGSPVLQLRRFDNGVMAGISTSKSMAGWTTAKTLSLKMEDLGGGTHRISALVDGVVELTFDDPSPIAGPGFVGVGGRNGNGADLVANDTLAPAPTFATQPSNTTVSAPATASFSASVSGTYSGLRWQRQAAGAGAWADVVGGTGGTTTSFTTGATAVSGGSFNNTDKIRLAVDWSGGVVTSNEVTLTVSASGTPPSFSVQPANQTATVGGTATFNFTVAGSGSLTVQAKKNGTDVGSPFAVTAGASASYTTPSLLIGDNGASYTFVATGDTAPTATSSAASLTVLQPLATTFTFTLNGGNSLTGLKYAVFDQVTPDLWTAPAKKAANGSSNGSGVVTVDVTGLTTRRIGELGSVFVTNSDGTATGGSQAATRRGSYYVGAFA